MTSTASRDSSVERTLDLVVEERTEVSDGVVALKLRHPSGSPLPTWEPGAHLDLVLEEGLERQYSLCGDPDDRAQWRVGVLREPEGRGGSAFIHGRVQAGSVLTVHGPRNHFRLLPASSYQFIAGGIGITPILPMIRAAENAGVEWHLLYGGRSAASMAFLEELGVYGDKVSVQPQDRHGLLELPTVLGTVVPGRLVYACGPEPLLGAVEQAVAAWPRGSLHVERFAAKADDGHHHTERGFAVELRSSGKTIEVQPGQSIVAALRAAGIKVNTSCQEGVCGTCETAVLGGVPDHRDSILTEEEREANDTMMICVGRSFSDVLLLDR